VRESKVNFTRFYNKRREPRVFLGRSLQAPDHGKRGDPDQLPGRHRLVTGAYGFHRIDKKAECWHCAGAAVFGVSVPMPKKTVLGHMNQMCWRLFPLASKIQLKLPERKTMKNPSDPVICDNDIQQFTIHLPCRLAERVEKYADENGNSVTGVVIEALDTFLRGKKLDLFGW
jgi:hypothetical protein